MLIRLNMYVLTVSYKRKYFTTKEGQLIKVWNQDANKAEYVRPHGL
ncbi:hypothetical protein MetMK1DRAFT_00003140 [Metallosphaera yellowstonensis MK1]|uniref:Uncharacterized protein n=1 Tax=Metallosphaera yellowstonensis MK1 TaxID=671065 RepID=H2C4E7_9CREN|nr:hypothetical protein [Metallosphaera yellowstonensis]EHP69812.1 hypothetical protein MetMK1DRAFT_00003140 [Metallosphaera yellowstonensis MK1]